MHCQNCGRDISSQSCVHTTNFTTKDQIFIMILVITFPAMLYGLFFNILGSYDKIDYLLVGSIAVSTILVIFLVAYYKYHKLYLVLFFGCHQRMERSFVLFHKPFLLCARCSGIMMGMFLSIFITFLDINYWYVLLFLLPLVIDGGIQKFTSYLSNNTKRFVTGLLAGPSFVLVFGFVHYWLASTITSIVIEIIKSTL